MPLIPIVLDDDLYRQLQEAASHKKVSIINYIKDRLAQIEGEVLEIEGEPGEGIAIQPFAVVDDGCPIYMVDMMRSAISSTAQQLRQIADSLYVPWKDIPEEKSVGVCDDTLWLAEQVLERITFARECLEEGVALEDKEGPVMQQAATMFSPRTPTADEIEAATAAFRPTFQPAAALDEEYQCGFTLSHLRNARQKLLEISVFLGHPLAETFTRERSTCKDAQWQALRILAELTWLSRSMEEDAYRVVDASRAVAKADVAEDFEPFWMVVKDNGDGREMKTTKRQPAMYLAEQEAERLCGKERAPFLIFHAVARCDAGPTPINWQLAKDHRP